MATPLAKVVSVLTLKLGWFQFRLVVLGLLGSGEQQRCRRQLADAWACLAEHWHYLKSESIVVPVLLHSLGNLCALVIQVGGWYWLWGGQ